MLELTPTYHLSAQTREALKKLDANSDNGISLTELGKAETDGKAGLSKAELLAAGVAEADLDTVQKALASHGSDPNRLVFDLEAEAFDQILLDNLAQKDAKDAKDVRDTKTSTPNPLNSLSDSHDPIDPKLSDSMKQNRLEIYWKHLVDHLPADKLPQGKLADKVKQLLASYSELPRYHAPLGQPQVDILDSLVDLAKDGRLDQRVADQLNALADPKRTPLHPKLAGQRSELLLNALGEITRPDTIAQHSKGTCAATSCQILLATRDPARYISLVAGLASPSGKLPANLFPAADQIQRHAQTLDDDKSGRTLSCRLIQPALMEYANDAPGLISTFRGRNYDNLKDKHSGAIGEIDAAWVKGLAQSETTHLLNGIFGEGRYRSQIVERNVLYNLYPDEGSVESPETVLANVRESLASGQPVPVGMRWDGKQKADYHEVLLTRLDKGTGYAYFLNPWGEAQKMPLAEFESRLASASLATPGTRPLPGSGDALNRLPGAASKPGFYEEVPWHKYQNVADKLAKPDAQADKLSATERETLLNRFDKLKLNSESFQQLLEIVASGKYSQTLLDRLDGVANAEQAVSLISIARDLAQSALPADKAQAVLAAYPEKHLDSNDQALLGAYISRLKPLPGDSPDKTLAENGDNLKLIDELVAKAHTRMAGGLVSGADPAKLSQADLRSRLETFASQGRYDELAQLAALADAGTKSSLIDKLMSGYTSERAERAIGIVIGQSSPAQQHEILARLDLRRLGSEMERPDRAAEGLRTILKAGFDGDVLAKHLNGFFDGVSSQSWGFNLFNSDDDTAMSFLKKLDQPALKALPDSLKTRFFKALDGGTTSSEEFAAMRRIAAAAAPATQGDMITQLMNQSTTAEQERLIVDILRDAPPKQRLAALARVDCVKLADELENDSQAAEVGVMLAEAARDAGQKPIAGKFSDFARGLAHQHRDAAIRALIDSPAMQREGRGLYQAIDAKVLKAMTEYLMNGDTNEAEEDTIMKILANTSFAQYGQIMSGDKAYLARLGDELDAEDIQKLDQWTAKYQQWRAEQ